ncbi:MAG: cytochrome c family protein [Myxococcaceae bacterium]|nr:cytochrome c family protein [Myxococcaceae bacterium]MCI0673376.1 cytochrome c family protein [Myxococcaceae bacterium]
MALPIALATVALGGAPDAAEPTAPDAPTPRFPKGTAPMQLGPLPAGLATWDAATCARCHPDEAEAWSRSGHARARTDLLFQAALTQDRPEWCVGCHAPLARDTGRVVPSAEAPREERGVTCAACHAVDGAVAAGEGTDGRKAPHTVAPGPHLTDSALCAGCHQFGFLVHTPASLPRLSGPHQQQQNTYREWLEWRRASGDSRTCQRCHMPGGDHSLGGVRRVEALREAMRVELVEGGRALEVWAEGVGHAMPTGDVMRWLSVEVAPDVLFERSRTVARLGRTLALDLWPPERSPHLGVRHDTALKAGERRRISLPTPPDGAAWTAWRLVYHLASESQEREGLVPPEDSRLILHSGLLPARSTP